MICYSRMAGSLLWAFCMAWTGLGLMQPAAALAATFSVTVDHTTTGSNHTLQLAARLEGSSGDFKLDISPLEKDFYVTAEHDRHLAGQWREKHYRLGAKHKGLFRVPALSVTVDGKKLRSQPFQIRVLATDGEVDDVRLWVEDSLDRKQAWVGQQLAWRMRVLSSYPFAATPEVGLPKFDGFDVRKVRDGASGSAVLKGRRAYTKSWLYLLYPRHAGELHITRPVVAASLSQRVKTRRIASGNPDFDAGETHLHSKKAHGNALTVQVRALPPAAAGLPVGELAIASATADAKIYSREPLTWNIHLTGKAVKPDDMPDLWKILELDRSVAAVREKPLITVRQDGAQMRVEQLYRLILTPRSPGRLQLPAIDVAFFNPDHGRIEHARVAARAMQVAPARHARRNNEGFEIDAVAVGHAHDGGQGVVTGWWKLTAIAMFVLWLATVVAWLFQGRAGLRCKLLPGRRQNRRPSLRQLRAARDSSAQFDAMLGVVGLPDRITPLGLLALFPELKHGEDGEEFVRWLTALEQGRWRHGQLPASLDEKYQQQFVNCIDAAIQARGNVAPASFNPACFGRIGG